jgi:hypothetical protein
MISSGGKGNSLDTSPPLLGSGGGKIKTIIVVGSGLAGLSTCLRYKIYRPSF